MVRVGGKKEKRVRQGVREGRVAGCIKEKKKNISGKQRT